MSKFIEGADVKVGQKIRVTQKARDGVITYEGVVSRTFLKGGMVVAGVPLGPLHAQTTIELLQDVEPEYVVGELYMITDIDGDTAVRRRVGEGWSFAINLESGPMVPFLVVKAERLHTYDPAIDLVIPLPSKGVQDWLASWTPDGQLSPTEVVLHLVKQALAARGDA